MGLPVNMEIDGRYVVTHEYVGINSKVIATRLSDNNQQQLVMKSELLFFFDAMCQLHGDQVVMANALDLLFA